MISWWAWFIFEAATTHETTVYSALYAFEIVTFDVGTEFQILY